MPVKLYSTVATTAIDASKRAQKATEIATTSITTGNRVVRPADDLLSTIEILNGKTRISNIRSAEASLTRLQSIISTRVGFLQQLSDNVSDLCRMARDAQGGGRPATEIQSISTAFNVLTSTVATQTTTADYDGVTLANIGGASGLQPLSKTVFSPVSSSVAGGLAGFANNAGALTVANQVTHVTCAAVQDGDTLTVGGVTLTFKSTGADATKGQVQIVAGDNTKTALNTLDILNSYSAAGSDGLRGYTFSTNGEAQINVSTASATYRAMGVSDVTSSNNARIGVAVVAPAGGHLPALDFYQYSDAGAIGQLGQLSGTVVTGAGQAAMDALAASFGPTALATYGNGGLGYAATNGYFKTTFTIGSTNYIGLIASTNAANAPGAMFCKRADNTLANPTENQIFRVNFNAAAQVDTFANASAGYIAAWNGDSAGIVVKQNVAMATNTSAGDILSNGRAIGTVRGLAANLQSSNVTNNNVKAVSISGTGVVTVTINNGTNDRVFTSAALGATLAAGSQIVCTEAASGDTFTMTVGDTALDCSTATNQGLIGAALQSALSSSQSSSFIVGPDTTSTLQLKLNDMTWSIISSGQTFDISTTASALKASTALDGILTKVNLELGLTGAYQRNADSLVAQNSTSRQNLEASVNNLSTVDVLAAKADLDRQQQTIAGAVTAYLLDVETNRLLRDVLQR